MAAQQNTPLANLLAQKYQLHIQLGHVQNQIDHIQALILSNQHSALNVVHLPQLQGQHNHLSLTLDALESRIKTSPDNRLNFTSYCQIYL